MSVFDDGVYPYQKRMPHLWEAGTRVTEELEAQVRLQQVFEAENI
jgi:hypothetical protein